MLPPVFKVVTYTPRISVAVQQWLLNNGYSWELQEQIADHRAFPYIYVDHHKMLWDTDGQVFIDFPAPEVVPQFHGSIGVSEKLIVKGMIEYCRPELSRQ